MNVWLTVPLALCLAGCASQSPRIIPSDATRAGLIRTIRFKDLPRAAFLEDSIREKVNLLYPQVQNLFGDHGKPPRLEIVFRNDLTKKYGSTVSRSTRGMPKLGSFSVPGARKGSTIFLDPTVFARSPAQGENILIHEMAHVVQDYRWYTWFKIPSYWREGIAEYAACKLMNADETDPSDRPVCTANAPHYTCGYSSAAAFLLFVEKSCGSRVVQDLNRTLRRGAYTDCFFKKKTGRSIDELWREFLETDAVTPFARRINQIYDELGFTRGVPPRDVDDRFEKYLAQNLDSASLRDLEPFTKSGGKRQPDIQTRITLYLYLSSPGGSVLTHAIQLKEAGLLPGFAAGDHGSIYEPAVAHEMDEASESLTHSIHVTKDRDSTSWNYTFSRACPTCPWEISKVWHADRDGMPLIEPPVE